MPLSDCRVRPLEAIWRGGEIGRPEAQVRYGIDGSTVKTGRTGQADRPSARAHCSADRTDGPAEHCRMQH